MSLPTRFISSYNGRADYGVYVRRLDRDIRVTRDQTSGDLSCTSGDATAVERDAAIASVTAFLAAEHVHFLDWCAEKGVTPPEPRTLASDIAEDR